MPKVKLEPADKKRCQADYTVGGPFRLGGPRRWVRCESEPVFIVTERTPGPDGQKGSMSLCQSCALAFVEKHGQAFAIFKPIPPKKGAQRAKDCL